MAFVCPACGSTASLEITKSLELPSDCRSDEIALQIVLCRRCRFEAIAVYEESRRGPLGRETVDHRGYFLSRSELHKLKGLASSCPRPRETACRCLAHQQLADCDASGRWNGLASFGLGESFPMQLS